MDKCLSNSYQFDIDKVCSITNRDYLEATREDIRYRFYASHIEVFVKGANKKLSLSYDDAMVDKPIKQLLSDTIEGALNIYIGLINFKVTPK